MSGNMEKRITAKMVLDSSGFNDSLKGVNAGLRNVKGELKDASAQIGTFGKDSERLKGVQEALGKQYELQAKKVDIYKKSIEKTSTKLQDNVKDRDKLKASLDSANKSYDEAIKLYGKESEQAKKAKEQISQLESEYKKKDQAIESNAKAIERYEGNLNRANAQLTKTQGELNKVNAELEKSNNRWIQAGETLTKTGDKMRSAGKGMTSVGNNILKATAPLVGMGIASLKVSGDFEKSMSEVQAISGATGSDLDRLEAKAKEMGKSTSKSASESAQALKYMSLAGWDVNESIEGLEPILRLAEAGSMNLANASDLTTDSMSSLGLEVGQLQTYLDKVAKSQASANTSANEMLQAYVIAGGTFKNLNVDLDTSATLLGVLANRGIKGSEAGNKINSTLVNLSGSTEKTKDVFKELGIEIYDQEGKYIGIESVLESLGSKFEGMTEEQSNFYKTQLVGKTQLDTINALLAGMGDEYSTLKTDIEGADGALEEMAKTMQDNMKGELTKLKSQLEGVGIQLGETLIPMASDFISVISDWVEKFSELDPKTQEMIVKTTALGVGLGGLLSVGGKVVSGAGSIIGVVGKLAIKLGTAQVASATATTAIGGVGTAAATAGGATGLGALASGLGGVVVGAAPFLAAGAAIAGTGYLIHKELSERAIPTVKLFDETISESTKENIGNFLELEQKATVSLNQLAWSGAEVTEEMKNNVLGNFTIMKDEVVSKLQEQKTDAVKEIEDMLKESTSLTEEEKLDMIKLTQDKYDNMIKQTEDGNKRIIEILDKAKDENRKVTDEERKEIIKIKEDMKEQGVRILSESETESLAILENLKAQSDIITAEMASEVVQNSLNQKEQSIKNAEEEYKERLRYAATLRADGSKESEDLADKIVEEAKRQKDEAVKYAEEMHANIIKEAKAQSKEHIEEIDWETGEIMSRWDKLKKWFSENPIVRWIKTKVDESQERGYVSPMTGELRGVRQNWRGNNNFEGGLTTLHEKGYEVYSLPRGTQIFNHEASQDMVIRTAEAVARRIVSTNQSSGGTTQNITFNTSQALPASEIVRRFKNVNKELAMGI